MMTSLSLTCCCLFIIFNTNVVLTAPDPSSKGLKIVGGDNATITDYPYQVSIQFGGQHGCGGSIINEYYILTAAHCTFEEAASDISVRVNSSYRNEGGEVFQILQIFLHPNFNSRTFDYDISILQLVGPLTFGEGVRPITIASAGTQINDGLEAVATGWGLLGQYKPASYQLQVVSLPVISTVSCSSYYPSGFVTERMFCAGYDDGGKDTCQGDSGGPLVVSGIQIGVTSWGIICAAPKQPGAFTKLPEFEDYIKSVINS